MWQTLKQRAGDEQKHRLKRDEVVGRERRTQGEVAANGSSTQRGAERKREREIKTLQDEG